MTDPYKILGIAPSATDDEVKKAYRNLCRKYHPDKNPGNKAAEEMFKVVQSAYETVMKERNSGGFRASGSFRASGGSTAYSGTGNQQYRQRAAYEHPEASYYRAAATEISNCDYRMALSVLKQIRNRNAYWYYLSALANEGIGNNYVAKEYAQVAAALEPKNDTYRTLVQQLSNTGMRYRSMRKPYYYYILNDECSAMLDREQSFCTVVGVCGLICLDMSNDDSCCADICEHCADKC